MSALALHTETYSPDDLDCRYCYRPIYPQDDPSLHLRTVLLLLQLVETPAENLDGNLVEMPAEAAAEEEDQPRRCGNRRCPH